jgi:AAA+ ATPase superfamily predicted ATPase
MSAIPFVFGKKASAEDFTNRVKERERLKSNFRAMINTALISPRRWGKSSLVEQVASDLRKTDKSIVICTMDLFNTRNETEFYAELATAVLKATSGKLQEWKDSAGKFLTGLRPQITYSVALQDEVSLGFEWDGVKRNPNEVLDLAQSIAQEKGISIVVCIDEFQRVIDFKDSLDFQRKLRAHWQNHKDVAYCLYGSKRHMLMDIFSNPDNPFYRFGDIVFLEKISTSDWIKFICGRFSDTGKHIDSQCAQLIAELVSNHPYYVQQLAQTAWLRTQEKCSQAIVQDSLDSLKDQLGLSFTTIAETLTVRQVSFLKAIIDGVKEFQASSILRSYDLGTAGNIRIIKQALERKEIIDASGNRVEILDPLFKYWLEQDYFTQPTAH